MRWQYQQLAEPVSEQSETPSIDKWGIPVYEAIRRPLLVGLSLAVAAGAFFAPDPIPRSETIYEPAYTAECPDIPYQKPSVAVSVQLSGTTFVYTPPASEVVTIDKWQGELPDNPLVGKRQVHYLADGESPFVKEVPTLDKWVGELPDIGFIPSRSTPYLLAASVFVPVETVTVDKWYSLGINHVDVVRPRLQIADPSFIFIPWTAEPLYDFPLPQWITCERAPFPVYLFTDAPQFIYVPPIAPAWVVGDAPAYCFQFPYPSALYIQAQFHDVLFSEGPPPVAIETLRLSSPVSFVLKLKSAVSMHVLANSVVGTQLNLKSRLRLTEIPSATTIPHPAPLPLPPPAPAIAWLELFDSPPQPHRLSAAIEAGAVFTADIPRVETVTSVAAEAYVPDVGFGRTDLLPAIESGSIFMGDTPRPLPVVYEIASSAIVPDIYFARPELPDALMAGAYFAADIPRQAVVYAPHAADCVLPDINYRRPCLLPAITAGSYTCGMAAPIMPQVVYSVENTAYLPDIYFRRAAIEKSIVAGFFSMGDIPRAQTVYAPAAADAVLPDIYFRKANLLPAIMVGSCFLVDVPRKTVQFYVAATAILPAIHFVRPTLSKAISSGSFFAGDIPRKATVYTPAAAEAIVPAAGFRKPHLLAAITSGSFFLGDIPRREITFTPTGVATILPACHYSKPQFLPAIRAGSFSQGNIYALPTFDYLDSQLYSNTEPQPTSFTVVFDGNHTVSGITPSIWTDGTSVYLHFYLVGVLTPGIHSATIQAFNVWGPSNATNPISFQVA
jgi:hypothetical protein